MEFRDGMLVLGKFKGEGEILWPAFEDGHHKIALLGKGDKFNKTFEEIERKFLELEGVPYFSIDSTSGRKLEREGTLTNIIAFERDHPANSISNEILSEQRKELVNMYMEMMTSLIGVNRKKLVIGYRPTLEGPLYGHIRSAAQLEGDEKYKFEEQLKGLDNVLWQSDGDLFSYQYGGNTDEEKLLGLLKGVWSFWVFSMITPVEAPRVLHINIPDSSSYSEVQIKYLDRMIELLCVISNMSNMVLILSTNSMSPLKRAPIRYKLLVKKQGIDYDLSKTSLDFDDNGDSFVLIDDVHKQKMVGVLHL
ncbi:hypothetical protein QTG56_23070 (plasmid) [Rossellomorea sp. AcN35-11]|nr:hypothetical protein [Rossellomorea aquimaris]WJV32248.1 hypothetical protein QTG56_23070 [Rossellomorea sp. AcN35-11]